MAVGKYQTKETLDKAFTAALRAAPVVKFAIKSSDKAQGTIQASRAGSDSAAGREFASLFVMVRRDADNTIIEATFTRNPGYMGGGKPDEWAKQFGDELKSNLPDLAVDVTAKK
jgi:hypothetical protein